MPEVYDLFDLPRQFGKLSQADLYNGKRIADLSREYIVTGSFQRPENYRSLSAVRIYC